MPVFNVSFLNAKNRGKSSGSGVGILADQLTILQNELAKDGYLSPGDYDILIKKAREIQTTANLTADQRSNYDVKISSYESAKAVSQFQKNEELDYMSNEMKNASLELSMVKGNNPAKYLDTKAAMLKSRLDDLSQIIDRRSSAGEDVMEHQAEYYNTLGEYQNILDAAKGADSYMNWLSGEESKKSNDPNYQMPSNQPVIDGYVAYVSTNRKGEITDIDYAPMGDRDGYMETNGIIGGFRIMAKPIKKGGYYTFRLGNDNFMVPEYDPANPMIKPSKLIAGTTAGALGPQAESTSDIFYNPESVRMQIGIPIGGYAKSLSGSYYKKNGPSDYTKYINFKPEEMGIDESDIISIPKVIEDSIIPFSKETIDASAKIMPNTMDKNMSIFDASNPFNLNNPYTPSASSQQSYAPQMQSSGQNMSIDKSRTGATKTPQQPTPNAPATFGSTIQRTVKSGVDFVKNLFR